MAEAAVKERGVAGRDRKKISDFKDVKRVYEFEDGSYIGYLDTAEDTAMLGKVMGHCSGTHFIWTIEEKIWYFLALFDAEGVPRVTIHAKQATWMNRTHPRDRCPAMPARPRNYGGGYPTFAHVQQAFMEAGLEYEPGKYKPLQYDSCTYDYGADRGAGLDSWDYRVGNYLIAQKPDGVSKEHWDAYVKSYKAMKDEYDKAVGAIKIEGRRFKFDGKWLIVLSASDKSHYDCRAKYRKQIAEWLNSTTKKEKK